MQNRRRTLRLIVVIILNIIVLGFLIAASNFTHAQNLTVHQQQLNSTVHQETIYYLYEKHTTSKKAGIAVGREPVAIGVLTEIKYML